MRYDEGEAPCARGFVNLVVYGSDLEARVQRILVFGTEGKIEFVWRQELNEG